MDGAGPPSSVGCTAPLLLIHGYGCSRAAMVVVASSAQAHPVGVVATINLEPIYTDIEHYVGPLAQRIDTVLAETGAARLILVGHSMGGLVIRAYLRRHRADKCCASSRSARPTAAANSPALPLAPMAARWCRQRLA